MPRILVLRTQGSDTTKTSELDAGVAKMKARFSSCGKRSTKNQSKQLQQVAVGAMGLVCDEFGAPLARRLAARVSSSKLHIPCISTPIQIRLQFALFFSM